MLRNASTPCAGTLTAWEYYRTHTAPTVWLDVWRNSGTSKYRLVNSFKHDHDKHFGWNKLHLPEKEWVDMEAGDFIGLHYDYEGEIPAHPVVPAFYKGQVRVMWDELF